MSDPVPRLPPEQPPLVDDVSDEEQVAKAREKEARQRARDLEDLGVVLSTADGRRFVWRLLAPAFRLSFTGEALSSAFNEGARSTANAVLADVNEAWPHRYLEMMREANRSTK